MQLAFILVEPKRAANVGAAARAACNMGIRNLVVVAPERYDLNSVMKLATHAARKEDARIGQFGLGM